MTELIKNIRYVALAAFALMVSACSSVDEPEYVQPSGDNDDTITLSLRMPFTGATSRADEAGHPEVDSEYPSFEDYVNPKDIGIFIFLGKENDAPLVMKWAYNSTDPRFTVEQKADGSYQAHLKLSRVELLKMKPGVDIAPGSTENIYFRIVVLANEKLAKVYYRTGKEKTNTYNYNTNTYTVDTYGKLINRPKWDMLNLGTDFYPPNESYVFQGLIPLYGMNLAEVPVSELYNSNPDNVIDLGDVLLLRSLVKVKLVDHTSKTGEYPMLAYKGQIVDSKENKMGPDGGINYLYRRPLMLPFDAINYQNGYQISNVNIDGTSLSANGGTVADIKNIENEEPNVIYNSYLPEQTIGDYNGTQYPYFRFYYKLNATTDWREFIVDLKGSLLSDGNRGLLRNHIYSIVVKNDAPDGRSGDGSGISITQEQCEW